MDLLVHWVRVDSSGLGRPQLPGDCPVNSMAVPMMLLCLVDQLTEGRAELAEKYSELGDWCVSQILQHVQVCDENLMTKYDIYIYIFLIDSVNVDM